MRFLSFNLKENFATRQLFGLIGFSYLRTVASDDPVAYNDPALVGRDPSHLPPFWAIHFFLSDRGILEEFTNAPQRSALVWEAMGAHQCQIPHGLDPKTSMYGVTPNLLKVVSKNTIIAELENEIEL